MYLIQVTYTKPIEEIDKHLADHRSFLDKYYSSGNLICSGPRNPRTGGIILCNFASVDYIWSFIHQDPFYINKIARYKVIEFNPVKFAYDFKPFIE